MEGTRADRGISAGAGKPAAQADPGGQNAGGGFFSKCLAKNRGSAPEQYETWRNGIYDQIREWMSMQGKLSIERMCQLACVSRAGFYRSLQEREPLEENMEVRSMIQKIFAEHKRRYGYRRVSAELRRRGMPVNHKRVARLMREDNLLAVQPKWFVITTDSEHELEVHLNLAGRMTLTGINQLWVADMTYIRLHSEFVYLAVILDAFSRKVIGWELDRTLAARLPIAALEKAIADRKPPPGVVHHSDRGIQYACGDYAGILRRHGIIPSMSRPANPYDNASCESFMKTLKREEIHAGEYRDLDHLRENITAFIDGYYNRVRLHSALGYKPPEEFEQAASPETVSQGATMSFFRHREIYQSDVVSKAKGESAETGSPDHRLDESPSGYSSAGCSPAEPASASPDADHCGAEESLE
jgi:transposase InsO family protein